MRWNKLPMIGIYWVFLFLAVFAFSTAQAGPKAAKTSESASPMTPQELQAAVLSYANRFINTMGSAATRFEFELPTREARALASGRRVYSFMAVVEAAAGPNPGAALLDLVVMTTLNRIAWEDFWRPRRFGLPATIMVDAFKEMEKEAWDLAAKVLTPQQIEELRDLILDYSAANPDLLTGDWVSLSDFGDWRKPGLKKIQEEGGLLAPVREAIQTADELRMTSERAMFLVTKMQLIATFQMDLALRKWVLEPDVAKLLEDISKFREATEHFAVLMEKLPADVAQEREAVLKALDVRESKIRGIMGNVQTTLDRVDGTFANLQQTTADAERLLAGAEKTGLVFQDLVQSADRLAGKFESKGSQEPAKPFDIDDYSEALTRLQNTVKQLNELVYTVDQTSFPLISNLTREFNDAAEKRVDHVFWRLAELFGIIGFLVLIIVVVHNLLKHRLSG
jgi:cytochrome c556